MAPRTPPTSAVPLLGGKKLAQPPDSTLNHYPVVFTGGLLLCRADRDNVHTQHCCYRMLVQHSIALPLLHRRQCHLWYRRQWHLRARARSRRSWAAPLEEPHRRT